MKNFDFSKPGGMPRTQDDVDAFLQTAWQEVVGAILASGSALVGGPYVLTGMVSTVVGPTTFVSAGWFIYQNTAVYFPAQSYTTAIGGGNAVYVVVTPTLVATAVPYNDGSTPLVKGDATGVLTVLPNSTPIDATHFLLGSLQPWGMLFPFADVTTFGSVGGYTAASVGAPYHDVAYKLERNVVTLSGVVAVSIPAPGTFTLFTLPQAAWPNHTVVINPLNTLPGLLGLITISTAGVVSFSNDATVGNGYVYLDGVSFRIY